MTTIDLTRANRPARDFFGLARVDADPGRVHLKPQERADQMKSSPPTPHLKTERQTIAGD